MRYFTYIISIGIALLFSTDSQANRTKSITSKDGLSNNAVYNIYQSDLGELFIGTLDGLNIWNGRHMETSKAAEFNQFFKGNKIRYIFPYDKAHILVLSRYGLAKLNTDTKDIQFYKHFQHHNMVCVAQNGNIFSINENREIEYFEIETGTHHTLQGFRMESGTNCMRMTITEKGDLHIFTNAGSYYIQIKYESEIPEINEVQPFSLQCEYISQPHCDGPIFIISEKHTLLQFHPSDGSTRELAHIKYPGETQWSRVNGVVEMPDGWYISFWDGIYFLRKGKTDLEKINLNYHIFTIVKDKKQPIIWIGSDSNGLIKYNLEDIGVRSITNDKLPYNITLPIRCIFSDKNKNLWIGTKGNGLLKLNNFDTETEFNKSNSQLFTAENSQLGHNFVYNLTESCHNGFYIGTEKTGINWYSYKTGKISTIEGSQKIRYVHTIEEQGDSLLWISTKGSIAYRCHITEHAGNPVVTAIDTISSQSLFGKNATMYPIMVQNDSTVWFGDAGYGVLRQNIKTGEKNTMTFPHDYGLACNEINYLYNGPDLVFATQNGIVVYKNSDDEGIISHYLPNQSAKAILKNSHGDFYVSTNSGIEVLDSNYNCLISFDRQSGLDVLEYSNSACYKDPETGTMYFGGINGFSVIKDFPINKTSFYYPSIEVTHLSDGNDNTHISKILKDGKLHIPYSNNTYTLHFSAIDNINPLGHEFLWSIEGYSKAEFTAHDFQLLLPKLNPGNYGLKIWNANEPEISCCLPLYITPPFYRTIWAYIVYTLITFAAIHFIARQIKKRYSNMRQQLKEKYTEQIKQIKQDTQSSIAEDLLVQITFILGLCQNIRSYIKSNTMVSEKVNMIEHNVNKISKTLNLYHSFEYLSTEIDGDAPLGLVDIGTTSKEVIDLIKSAPDTQDISISYNIDDNIIYVTNKDLYISMFKMSLNIAKLLISKQKKLNIEISNAETLKIAIEVPSNYEIYKIICMTDNHILVCKSFVERMNGQMTHSFSDGVANINISLPLESASSLIQPGIVTSVISSKLEREVKEPIYIISRNKDISSFLQYFMSEGHAISIFKDIDIAASAIEHTRPIAIIYDISSMYKQLEEFMTKTSRGNNHDVIPMIVISSSQQVEEREECIKHGVDLCLSFPFNINTLNTALKKLQDKREKLAEYYRRPISSFAINDGQIIHNNDKQLLKTIAKIIDERISDPALSAPKISEELGINTRELYRKLSKISDISLKQFIVETRMRAAASLLSSTKLTIDEVMYKVGYNNVSTFYRNFNNFHGMTPKEYREKIKNELKNSRLS